MRSALQAVAVAALLVLAGCNAVDPAPDPGPDPAPTTTRTPYPPGVTDAGLQNEHALVAAHVDEVHEHGVTVVSNSSTVVRFDDGLRELEFNATTRATPGLARVYYASNQVRVDSNGTVRSARIEIYANESAVTTRQVGDGNATTSTDPRNEQTPVQEVYAARAHVLRDALANGDFDVADTERRDGRTVTTLVADEEAFTDEGRTVFYATVEVADSGRVLSLQVTRNPNANTRADRRTTRVVWSAPSDVPTPEWAA